MVKAHREISLRLNLKRGKYVIVPSTREAGKVGKFTLSLYFDCSMNDIRKIARIDKKESKFIIEEEDEGIEFEDWKLDLISKRLKYMIGAEDTELDEKQLSSSVILKKSTLKAKEMFDFEEEKVGPGT